LGGKSRNSLTSRSVAALPNPNKTKSPLQLCADCVPDPGRSRLMVRKAGQLISRERHTWKVRISLGREPRTGTQKYQSETIRGFIREAQMSGWRAARAE